jgi:tetratricopeptide (TPR) repeat protein
MVLREKKEIKLCRWLTEQDEIAMIHAFVTVENANEAVTPDLFIRLHTPFSPSNTYEQELITELETAWNAYQKEISPDKPVSPLVQRKQNNSEYLVLLIEALGALADQAPEFEGHFVAFIDPSNISSKSLWRQWIEKALQAGIPDRVLLMTIDPLPGALLENTAKKFPSLVYTIKPTLDMPGAMRKIAASGDPNEPGVQFRKLFVELSQHVSNGRIPQMRQTGEAALAICIRCGWIYLQVAVYVAMAAGYMSKKQNKEALQLYDRAIAIARNGLKAGDMSSAKSLVQALFGKASILFGKKDFKAAALLYQEAVAPATDAKDTMQTMEAWRMTGVCLELDNKGNEAWSCYHQGLLIGEQLDQSIRPVSTLPFLGKSLLNLGYALGKKQDELIPLEQKMVTLCGVNWKELANPKPSTN